MCEISYAVREISYTVLRPESRVSESEGGRWGLPLWSGQKKEGVERPPQVGVAS